jgi:hypothetical protein
MGTRSQRLVVLTVAALAVGAWYAWTLLPADLAVTVAQAEECYRAAAEALAAGDAATAFRRFEELDAKLATAWRTLERAAGRKPAPSGERLQQLQMKKGEILYLKALRLRDVGYARAALEDKPIAELLDSSTGVRFRAVTMLPVEAERNEAIVLLRNAAGLLPDRDDVVTESLRTELMMRPVQWRLAHSLAESLLRLHPDDARSLYLLARIEFEQPSSDGSATPLEKRSASRVKKAEDYIAHVKRAVDYPLWRTYHLEAQIESWLLEDARRRRQPADAARAQTALEDLLWGRTAALRRARDGDGMKSLSSWDIDGAIGVFTIALDLRLHHASSVERAKLVADVDRELFDFCANRLGAEAGEFPVSLLSSHLLAALYRSRAAFAHDDRDEWHALLEAVDELWRPSLAEGQLTPLVAAGFADLLALEARIDRLRSPSAHAERFDEASAHWLRDGLKAAQAQKLTAAARAPLHASAAYRAIIMGDAPVLAAHLADLREVHEPVAQGTVQLFESLALLREGKLQSALDKLAGIHRLLPPDQPLRPRLLQAQAHLGLGHVDRVLSELRQLDQAFADMDKLSVQEQLWLADLVTSREQVRFRIAQTHLTLASEKRDRFARQHPGQPVPDEVTDLHERAVREADQTLPDESPFAVWLHQAETLYTDAVGRRQSIPITLTSRIPSARAPLAGFALELARVASPAGASIAELEQRLQARVRGAAEDQAARLALVLLLAQTGRSDQAAKMLDQFVASPETPGHHLLPDQLMLLADLCRSADRRSLWESLEPIFASALERYPFDPAVVRALGQARAARNDPGATELLRRADNLARARTSK